MTLMNYDLKHHWCNKGDNALKLNHNNDHIL
ncbi:hypothetical protein [Campylobacter phage CJLB-14]|nr:hypothetical protein [Campylobacter phage CJLB-14]